MKQVDLEKWLDRIDNSLAVQRDTGCEFITQTYTRRELIDLRLIVSALYEQEIRNRVITTRDGFNQAVDEFLFRIKNRKLCLEEWQWTEINQIAKQIKEK